MEPAQRIRLFLFISKAPPLSPVVVLVIVHQKFAALA
jgi:hypothetical protein